MSVSLKFEQNILFAIPEKSLLILGAPDFSRELQKNSYTYDTKEQTEVGTLVLTYHR